jgi:hypothetical protein
VIGLSHYCDLAFQRRNIIGCPYWFSHALRVSTLTGA